MVEGTCEAITLSSDLLEDSQVVRAIQSWKRETEVKRRPIEINVRSFEPRPLSYPSIFTHIQYYFTSDLTTLKGTIASPEPLCITGYAQSGVVQNSHTSTQAEPNQSFHPVGLAPVLLRPWIQR